MKKRLILVVAVVLLLAVGGVCLFTYFSESEKPISALEQGIAETVSTSFNTRTQEQSGAQSGAQSSLEEATGTETETDASVSQLASYVSPVDFDSLQAENDDIYAWFYIPGTDINYPVTQHTTEDEYYLKHNSTGDRDSKGALFTQATYNGLDFLDPVTVVYGHHMSSGTMFGHLQDLYSSLEDIKEHQEMVIYLPDCEIHYKVFAGMSYDNSHILYYNDFSDKEVYQSFLDEKVSSRSIGTCVDPDVSVSPDDRMLILSTCLQGNSQKRYLVLAVEDSRS